MRKTIILLIVVSVPLIIYWSTRNNRRVPPSTAGINSPGSSLVTAKTNRSPIAHFRSRTRVKPSQNGINSPEESFEQQEWEKKVDEILLSEGEGGEKAQQLSVLIPTLNVEQQQEVAEHMVNLLSDTNYAPAMNLLTNAHTAEPVARAVLTDLLLRSDQLKLPILLEIAATEAHPLEVEARETLGIYLREDFGHDWPKWKSALNAWLKENAEQPAP